MGEEAQTGHTDRNLTVSPAISGNNPLDKMKNVYDLEGNYFEWTAEANGIDMRVRRGGCCNGVSSGNFDPASSGVNGKPTKTYSVYSARAGLYVKI